MVATPIITKFQDLYDVIDKPGDGYWARQAGAFVWKPFDHETWRSPVDTLSDLPTVGNALADVRVVKADLSIHIWDGSEWVVGGGVGPAPTVGGNLFVQQNMPSTTGMTINTLWLATDSGGNPQALSTWEVYTGFTSGDGGNLFIQQNAPTPVVDALWIPLNVDGTAKYVDQWFVYTGRGSLTGVGNPNLFIGKTLPGSPIPGSLYIPLNIDDSPKRFDQWEVYA